MKKKYLVTLILAMIVILCLFSACQHVHEFYDWEITQEPTCTRNGLKEKVCECGEKFTMNIPSPGHQFADGFCTVCGEEQYPLSYNYTLSNDGEYYILSSVINARDEIVIPETYQGKPVTIIGANAFKGTNVQRVVIPKTVTTINNSVFENCTQLESVVFQDNSQLQTLGNKVFLGCSSLEEISLPSGVTSMGNQVFAGCSSLQYVTIPNGVTTIGTNAFLDCTSLQSISLPSGVSSISSDAFAGCTSLRNISVSEDNQKYKTVNGILYSKDGATLLKCPAQKQVQELTIPAEVTEIASSAFEGCVSIVNLVIPQNVTVIGTSAFKGCTRVQNLTIPFADINATTEGVQAIRLMFGTQSSDVPSTLKKIVLTGDADTIPAKAFVGCSSVTDIVIQGNVTAIDSGAFDDCTALQNVTLPASMTTIGDKAFYNCAYLRNVQWAEGSQLTTIGEKAFSDCYKLTSIRIPAGVTSIGKEAFIRCGSLTDVIFEPGSQLTTLGESAFSLCSSLQEITIPSGVVELPQALFYNCPKLSTVKFEQGSQLAVIGKRAFDYCHGLTTFTIPASVTTIGEEAFASCYYLETIIIEQGSKLTTIEYTAFGFITNLTSISPIPASVTTIGERAFVECRKLENFQFEPNSQLTTLGGWAFANTGITSIEIPKGVQSISDRTFSGCTKLKTIVFQEGSVCTSIGSYAFASVGAPNIQLPESVTSIGEYAFTASSLESITIPESVTTIGEYAFRECLSLANVTLPSELTYISQGAFYKCTSLKHITIPTSVVDIGASAFGMSGLKSITAQGSPHVGRQALNGTPFYDNRNNWEDGSLYLGNVLLASSGTVKQGTTSIADYAFESSSIRTITLPEGITCIGKYVFYNCARLTTIEIPNSVTIIYENAFNGCTALTTVTFKQGSQLQSIGDKAFYECQNLLEITLENCAELSSIGKEVFHNTQVATLAFSSKMENIDYTVFSGMLFVSNIVVDQNNPNYQSINGSLYSKDGQTLIKYAVGKNEKDVVLPEGVTTIGDHAFYAEAKFADGYTYYASMSMETITLPSSLETIGEHAFHGCWSLKSITIPASVTMIGKHAFDQCQSLRTAYFENPNGWYQCNSPDTMQYLLNLIDPAKSAETLRNAYRDYLWATERTDLSAGAQGLVYTLLEDGTYAVTGKGTCVDAYLVIPSTHDGIPVTAIGDDVFYINRNIVVLQLPASIKSIGYRAFSNCTLLERVVLDEGSNLTIIDDAAFSDCYILESFQIPSGVTYIGSHAFSGCKKLANATIPSGVTRLGNGAFAGCEMLTSVTFGEDIQITELEQWVFSGCKSLPSITIPSSIVTIGDYAFTECTTFTEITIPDGVKTIGEHAFYNCYNMLEIVVPNSVTKIGFAAFYNCHKLTSITVPFVGESLDGNKNTYFRYWFGGRTYNDDFNYPPQTLKTVTITGGTKLDKFAFYMCGKVETIIIPASVQTIGDNVFVGCTSLKNIVVDTNNPNYKTIDGNLYSKDGKTLIQYALGKTDTEVTPPAGVTEIADYAFSGCTNLVSITIPSSVTTIGRYAFDGCAKLETVTFEDESGWYVTQTKGATSGQEVKLHNTTDNATYLNTAYYKYYWYKK